MANATRTMTPRKFSNVNDRGTRLVCVVVAMDGLSIGTNLNNPVKWLTMDQVGWLPASCRPVALWADDFVLDDYSMAIQQDQGSSVCDPRHADRDYF